MKEIYKKVAIIPLEADDSPKLLTKTTEKYQA